MPAVWFPARKALCPHCKKPLKFDVTVRVRPVVKDAPLDGFAKDVPI